MFYLLKMRKLYVFIDIFKLTQKQMYNKKKTERKRKH